MTAHEHLVEAILDALRDRLVVPCVVDRRGLWVSDDQRERSQAAEFCDGCAVIEQCDAAAPEPGARLSFGVWAGRDRTPGAWRPRQTTEAAG